MSEEAPTIDATRLTGWAARLLEAADAPEPTANLVAASLVESDLRGYASHGVLRLPAYVDAIRVGTLDPRALPRVLGSGTGATFVVDGGDGFGQLTARRVVEEAASRARRHGLSLGLTRGCRHVGRLGAFTEELASLGFVSLALVSSEPLVAAAPGGSRILGTNPLSWGIPAGEGRPPVVVDMATSLTSAGRVFAAQADGVTLDDGRIVDRHGRPSTDPADLLAGGALLPAAGHKGFALALVADVVAGILSGTGSGSAPDASGAHGFALVAIDVDSVTDRARFTEEVELLRDRVSRSGAPDSPIRLPGEGSANRRRTGLSTGVTVPPTTAERLDALARSLDRPTLTDLSSAPA